MCYIMHSWNFLDCTELYLLRTRGTLDTGHFFNTSLIQGLVFEGIVKGQESKVWVWGPLNLLGPSKKSQLLDSWPLSMPLKTRPWMNLFKIFVLYLRYLLEPTLGGVNEMIRVPFKFVHVLLYDIFLRYFGMISR
jgi:hypothetical protein